MKDLVTQVVKSRLKVKENSQPLNRKRRKSPIPLLLLSREESQLKTSSELTKPSEIMN